jgi:hypothetical protein
MWRNTGELHQTGMAAACMCGAHIVQDETETPAVRAVIAADTAAAYARHLRRTGVHLPCEVRVILDRQPCAYMVDHLRLVVGDRITVTRTDSSGIFEGTLQRTGKTGKFPCTYVEWI